jgi:Na+/melibiose symporter-like transporter
MLLNLAHTVVGIPYAALTPDLTKDYDERTLLTTLRYKIKKKMGMKCLDFFLDLFRGLLLVLCMPYL